MNFFTKSRLLALRNEVEQTGFIVDRFLAAKPDCPVFGLNFACAYPFYGKVVKPFLSLAEKLPQLDKGAYVYPVWQTHITIATLINFSKHESPKLRFVGKLRALGEEVTVALTPLFGS